LLSEALLACAPSLKCKVSQNHTYIYACMRRDDNNKRIKTGSWYIPRVGQNLIYTVYIWYFRQGFCQIYGHIHRIHTGLANPTHTLCPKKQPVRAF